ncbi:type VII secretion protein EccB [Prauserella marina]|uniref:Type VII secretion protein EccB n=1 Tax=Prauserella marina TaxID=530584 RepID=A0A222VTQ4_9PSEU|nr:type VII secretion protein EccB [Prauserella marina]ASR37307.1 type VII secretion protein EccB [Prauserella marina]PWV74840.1 type VII secretion protein EccB [Prauserella marina]SDD39347.1 type VII secretion protein EccB [Prauserella marina]
MASRKDQLHSYQFMMQRVVSSVMVHETDPEQTPLRRSVGAVFGSVMIAAIIAAVFGIVGVLTNTGGSSWQSDGSVVIERETGAAFVYLDGELQPVLNYASARLLAGSGSTPAAAAAGMRGGRMGAAANTGEPFRVAGKSLAGIPRKPMVGIAGAPDSLPPPDRAITAPWMSCTHLGQDASGSPSISTEVRVGVEETERDSLGNSALLVRDNESGTRYLIWNNHRYRFAGADPDRLLRSIFGFGNRIVDVGSAWLNALPAGPDLRDIGIDGHGGETAAVPGHQIGDLLHHPVGTGEQYYVVLREGLAPITPLQMRIILGQHSTEPTPVSASMAGNVPVADVLNGQQGPTAPPTNPPPVADIPDSEPVSLCATTTGAGTRSTVSMTTGSLAGAEGAPTVGQSQSGGVLADRIHVPPGQVAVVRAMPSDTAQGGALNVVTDEGVRYPVPTDEELSSLGYDPNTAVPMPAALVQRIPAGPTLSSAAAGTPATPETH